MSDKEVKEKVVVGADSYNPNKGTTTTKIKIGNREFEIDKFNLNDIINIEEKLGGLAKIGEKIRNIRYVLWYAIHKKHKNITEEGVGEMIVASEIPRVTEELLKISDITANPTVTPKK
ncbi:unnamed protein product [marine sediment metagenome]|uniref:Uncharacterized protein n=1 Tax=marine sediment metagenome TaxID=412755 RepID=X1TZ32_9ZZZZ